MDQYFYILLDGILIITWLIILFLRRDLKKKLFTCSLLGGIMGILSELWYLKDYWRPLSFSGGYTIIEDFLFGFTIVGISATIYDVIFKYKNIKKERNKLIESILLFSLSFLFLLLLNNIYKINSIIVSSILFIICSLIIIAVRKDLLKQSFISGLLLVLFILPIYFILLNYFSPQYLEKHWLLYHSSLGITILGQIPLTEIIWYFSWGCLGGILYEFTRGEKKIRQ